jgi:hypothetical protein
VLGRPALSAFAVLGVISSNSPFDTTEESTRRKVAPQAVTLVAPVLTSGSRAVVRTRQPIIRATFLPSGTAIDTAATVLHLAR